MPLLKIKDFDPNYKEAFGGYDIKGLNVYSEINGEKIGTIHDLLIDEQGRFRYFIVDLGFWGFGKKVLLPVGRSQIDSEGKHVYALGFTKDQAENLPEFSEDLRIDNDYEDRVRGAYSTHPAASSQPMPVAGTPDNIPMAGQVPPPSAAPTGYTSPAAPAPNQQYHQPPSQPLNQQYHQPPSQPDYPQNYPGYDRASQGSAPPQPPMQPPIQSAQPSVQQSWQPRSVDSTSVRPSASAYDYQQDPHLYELNEEHHSILRRFEQRLQEKRMSGQR